MKVNETTIVAIDPGASGAIATFTNGKPTAVKMPKDVQRMQEYLQFLVQTYSNVIIFIEKVQAYGKDDDAPGKKFAINKMLNNYSELLTVIKLNNIPFIEVYPISWQSKLGLRVKREKGMSDAQFKSSRKNLYKDYAQNSFPELTVTLATSDALCLVQFAMDKIQNDELWIDDHIQNKPKNNLF